MSDISSIITAVVTVVTALGGVETVKYFMNRRAKSRIEDAKADSEEVHADQDEFSYLRQRIEFMEAQLVEKEQRFAEQTALVRKLQTDIITAAKEEIELTKQIGALQLELALKRCDRKGCQQRQPPNGY